MKGNSDAKNAEIIFSHPNFLVAFIQNVKTKIQRAIYNNNGLYEAIFENRQISFAQTDFIRYSLQRTPPLYSNLVTVSPHWKPDAIFQNINFNYEKEYWSEWSIKDSFGVLNLRRFGFTKLFEAQWIYLEAAKFARLQTVEKLRYEIVRDADVLTAWRNAWDSDEKLGKEIFNPKLLENSNVYFVAGFDGNKILSGCLVNKTDIVLGISNFFAPDESIIYWSDIIGFIYESIEQADIVGYERTKLVNRLQILDFELLGGLAVWLKKRISV